jgi:hypothetical protein
MKNLKTGDAHLSEDMCQHGRGEAPTIAANLSP